MEPLNQSVESPKNSKTGLAILISVLVTALMIGGGMYYLQQQLQSEIIALEETVTTLKESNAALQAKPVAAMTEPTPAVKEKTSNPKLPVITYIREGLLTNAERKKLEEKLINPQIDYYNEKEPQLVAIAITVPTTAGGPYEVLAIGTSQIGTAQFGFGKRQGEYGFWMPGCMGPCELSEAFKKKYPEIYKEVGIE